MSVPQWHDSVETLPPVRGVRRRFPPWLCLLAAFAAGSAAGVGAAVWYARARAAEGPEVYALLLLNADKKGKLFEHPEEVGDFDEFRRTQAELLKSRLVLTAALRQPGVAELKCLKNTT